MHATTPPTRSRPSVTTGPGSRGVRDGVGQTLLRGRLLFSSYAPLNAILFARIDGGERFVFAALAIVGLLDASRLTWLAGRVAQAPRIFVDVRDAGAEVAGYLATYLLPFLAAPHATTSDVWAYGIYAIVVIVITLRSNLGAVNPTIYLLGWRVVTVTLQDGRERFLICRHVPRSGERVGVRELYGVLQAQD
jgi:hypothetical protein